MILYLLLAEAFIIIYFIREIAYSKKAVILLKNLFNTSAYVKNSSSKCHDGIKLAMEKKDPMLASFSDLAGKW